LPDDDGDDDGTVFVPAADRPAGRRRRLALWGGTALVATIAIAVVVAWPTIREWYRPAPPADPVEAVAQKYLQALIKGDAGAAARLGTVEIPPAIRSVRALRREPASDKVISGSFGPVAAFHRGINDRYVFDPGSGRYTPKNALGPAAETLDALHAAKDKAEQDDIYKKMQSGDPEDIFDAAEGLARSFASLAEGALAPKKLVPTYEQLLADADPPLPPESLALLRDYAAQPEAWDALLKRPFQTIKADGRFILEKAEVTASVTEKLGSLGEPPTPLRLSLTRFRLEGIDTGWVVTGTRRLEPEAPPASSTGSTTP